eukprot:SAG22_NODE_980_length_6173_cov_5.884261_2_plen_73_part_00
MPRHFLQVLFNLMFDLIRLKHVGSVMAGSAYLEPENLAAQVSSFKTRTMSSKRPLLAELTESNPTAQDAPED